MTMGSDSQSRDNLLEALRMLVEERRKEVKEVFLELRTSLEECEAGVNNDLCRLYSDTRDRVEREEKKIEKLSAAKGYLQADLVDNEFNSFLQTTMDNFDAQIAEIQRASVTIPVDFKLEWNREELKRSIERVCRIVASDSDTRQIVQASDVISQPYEENTILEDWDSNPEDPPYGDADLEVESLEWEIHDPNNPDQTLDVNEEVFLSDLHVLNMEQSNSSWADSMKSPITPEDYAPGFSPSSSTSEIQPYYYRNHEETSYHQCSYNQQNRHSYPDRSRRDQGRQNRRQGGDPWKGEYSKGARGLHPSTPSLYIKCEYFARIQGNRIVQIMDKVLDQLLPHVQKISPDTKSGASIVFIDIDTHEHAIKIMDYLNEKVGWIDNFELKAQFARRYKQYLNGNKFY